MPQQPTKEVHPGDCVCKEVCLPKILALKEEAKEVCEWGNYPPYEWTSTDICAGGGSGKVLGGGAPGDPRKHTVWTKDFLDLFKNYDCKSCRKAYFNEDCDCGRDTIIYFIRNLLVSAHQEADQRVAEAYKAFGGCKNCYGKGYHTIKETATGKNYYQELDPIKFCKCDRGEQLKKVIATKEAEVVKEERERIVKLLNWRERTDDVKFYDGDDVVDWYDEKIKTLIN